MDRGVGALITLVGVERGRWTAHGVIDVIFSLQKMWKSVAVFFSLSGSVPALQMAYTTL